MNACVHWCEHILQDAIDINLYAAKSFATLIKQTNVIPEQISFVTCSSVGITFINLNKSIGVNISNIIPGSYNYINSNRYTLL
jgi:C4-dicarboxylate transporter